MKTTSFRKNRRPAKGPSRRIRPTLERLEAREVPVVYAVGFPSTADVPTVAPGTGYDGVVRIRPQTGGTCTGSLLSTGMHILTAAHCVDDDGDGFVDPGAARVTFQLPGRPPVVMSVPSSDIRMHPSWTGNIDDHRGDLAILMLPELAPLGAERYDLYLGSDEVTRPFTFVGYGRWNTVADGIVLDGTAGAGSPSGTKRSGQNVFDSVDGDVLLFDFDPAIAAEADGSLGDWEANTARGDSGGPSFLDGRIAAVTSGGNGANAEIGEVSFSTRVSALAGWIDSFTTLGQRIVVKMTTQLGAADGVADDILVRSTGSNFELFINGRLAQSLPKSQVISLEVQGSDDDETFTVEGGLDTIIVNGNGGTNSLVVDDRNLSSTASPYYAITDQAVTRLLSFGSFGLYDDVFYSGVQSIRLETSALHNRTDVNSNADGVTLTIVSHGSNNVTIGQGRLDAVGGRVEVYGTGRDNLTLNDAENTIPGYPWSRMTTYTLMNNSIQFSEVNEIYGGFGLTHNLSVAYNGVDLLALKAGSTSDHINIETHDRNLPANIYAGAGDDVITFSPDRHRMLQGYFWIEGGEGRDSLIFNDDGLRNYPDWWGYTNRPTFTVGMTNVGYSNEITDNLFGTTTTTFFNADHKEFETLVINGSTTGNLFNIRGTPAGAETLIRAGSGDDRVVAGAGYNHLQYLLSSFTIEGGDGTDILEVHDEANPQTNIGVGLYEVADQYVRAGNYIFHSDLEAVELSTSNRDDYVTVYGSNASTPVTISTNDGNDTITVGDAANSLDAVVGELTVHGSGGQDVLSLNDQGSPVNHAYVVTAGQVTRTPYPGGTSPSASIRYDGFESVDLNTSKGGNTTFVLGNPAGTSLTVRGNPGVVDTFAVGFASDLNQILGPVSVYGQAGDNDFAYYYDYLNTAPQTYTFLADPVDPTALRAERSGTAAVTYYGMAEVIPYLSRVGGNQANVRAVPANLFLNMVAYNNDVVTLGSQAPALGGTVADLQGTISVAGTGTRVILDDSGDRSPRQVSVNPKEDAYGDYITGLVARRLYTRLDATSSLTILGGQADDTFQINGTAFDTALRIDGGGVNTLDYSAVTPGVVVNLPLGTATGLTGGIANFRNVNGGRGNDILVGDAAANSLWGGAGRDLLIGGLGADVIDGGADDDIVIGGYTAYDVNPTALDAIMREWTRTDLDVLGPQQSYKARIDHLQSGGLNGAYVLKSSKGNGTVFNDGFADVLTGGDGLDWFFGDKKQDAIANVPSEKVS
jgi:Ca2+-binding RTX toxin-like protein